MAARSPRPRARGAKVPLSRDAVVGAALECLRSGGPGELTMRKVAARLETGPGSLYAHVRDQRELHVAVIDAIAADVEATRKPGDSPRDALVATLMDYTGRLVEHPGAAQIALLTPPTGPAYLRLMDTLAGLLLAEDPVPVHPSWAVDFLMLLVTAAVAEQDARDAAGESSAEAYSQVLAAPDDAGALPHLAALREDLFAGAGPERLEWTVRTFLTGLDARSQA